MITGKDNAREAYARVSIENFREQTYKNKHLVIINHGDYKLVTNPTTMFNVTEVHVNKTGLTLGDLRNMAFDFVPYNGLFCVWDDDDIRSRDFLEQLYNVMVRESAQAVCITNRIEYNITTGFAWRTILRMGCVHVLATKHYMIQYQSKDSMEDTELINTMTGIYKVHMIQDNDPTMYIRIVHGSNSSEFVINGKIQVVTNASFADWQEYPLTQDELVFLYKRLDPYLEKIMRPTGSS